MKILVIGRGGREHAIVHKVSQSNEVNEIFIAPGNKGMTDLATLVNINETNIKALVEFAKFEKIDLTIVGPESSLELGIVDEFNKAGLKIFGPSLKAVKIESSKIYAKEIMKKYNVPTGESKSFDNTEDALNYLEEKGVPIVIKYDGLAAGKGVVVAHTIKEATNAICDMLENQKYGKARVLIEEYLEGPEFSLMAFVNKDKVYPMQIAQDHKRAFENDKGPNTGGMGAYSNVPFINENIIKNSITNIMEKVAKGMTKDNNPFTGILYGGIISTVDGPKVIEFNARFGDPETEVVLPRLTNDLVQVIKDVMNDKNPNLEWTKDKTVGVVLASKGYPNHYEKGFSIKGLDKVESIIYHMGTDYKENEFVTNGGRVLIVVSTDKTFEKAIKKVYNEIEKIDCENLFYRKDIAYQIK